jgi:integrase/recombinase XerC
MNEKIIHAFFQDHYARFSAETIRSYRITLNKFFDYCGKNYNEIQLNDVRDWVASLIHTGLKPRTIRLKISAVKSFYRYAMEEHLLEKNPTLKIKAPKKEDSLPYYLSQRQLTLLQELTRSDIRDRAIVEALYATGVRVSELLQIKLEDIKWEKRLIWIRKGKGNKERFVLFSHECAERLKTYLHNRKEVSDYLFASNRGGHLSRILIEKRFQEFSKQLGFKVVPHTMRHTFAAYLAEKGMDFSYIQELLGHSNIESTRIYTRLMNHARKQKYDQFQK